MIQLVSKGPKIPEELHRLLIYDNLVFFCGAGISKFNGLPLFDELAEKVQAIPGVKKKMAFPTGA